MFLSFLSNKFRQEAFALFKDKGNFKCVGSNNSNYFDNKLVCPHNDGANFKLKYKTCEIYQLKHTLKRFTHKNWVFFPVLPRQHTMAIFTTLHLRVVHSSMLSSLRFGSCELSRHFSRALTHFIGRLRLHGPLPRSGSPLGTGFRRFGGVSCPLHGSVLSVSLLCRVCPPPLSLPLLSPLRLSPLSSRRQS